LEVAQRRAGVDRHHGVEVAAEGVDLHVAALRRGPLEPDGVQRAGRARVVWLPDLAGRIVGVDERAHRRAGGDHRAGENTTSRGDGAGPEAAPENISTDEGTVRSSRAATGSRAGSWGWAVVPLGDVGRKRVLSSRVNQLM